MRDRLASAESDGSGTPPPQEPDAAAVPIPENIKPFLGKWIETQTRAAGGRLVMEFRANGKGGYFIDVSIRNANGITELLASGQFRILENGRVEFDFPAATPLQSAFAFSDKRITLDPGTKDEDEFIAFSAADLSMNNGVILGRVLVQDPDGSGGGGTLASLPERTIRPLEMPFVPGDIVVRYRKTAVPTAKSIKRLRHKFQVVVEDPGRGSGKDHLLKIRPQAGTGKALRKATTLAAMALGYRDHIEELKELTLNVVDEMNQRPDVERAMPNFLFELAGTLPSEYSGADSNFWNMRAITATAGWTWASVWGGAGSFQENLGGIEVAVIDSGIVSHNELSNAILSDGYDFVPDVLVGLPAGDNDGDFDGDAGYDSNPTDPGDAEYNQNSDWDEATGRATGRCAPLMLYHGTHVAGIIGAARDNGGMVGVAPGVKILPVRVAGRCGWVDMVSFMMGVDYAAGEAVDVGGDRTIQRDNPVDVINLSLRMRRSQLEMIAQDRGNARRICDSEPGNVEACVTAIREPIDRATQKGIVVVAASGNDAIGACEGGSRAAGDMVSNPSYPASFDNVISVGAIDSDNRQACYSNFGKVDFVAPGGWTRRIYSSIGPEVDDFGPLAGTSQATPHIAGTVALLKAANPNLFPASFSTVADTDFYRAMKDAGSRREQNQDVGFGRVDIGTALRLVTQLEEVDEPFLAPPTPPPAEIQTGRPELQVTPPSVYLGTYGLLTSVFLSNRTGMGEIVYGEVTITEKSGDKPWINVSQPTHNEGAAMISISVDRTGLADGRYTAKIHLPYSISPPDPAEERSVDITVTIDVRTPRAANLPPVGSNLTEDLRRRVQEYIDQINEQEGIGAVTHDYGTMLIVLQDPIRCPDITSDQCTGLITTATDLESRYVFGFPTVPPGNYIMWAGSDDDGDGKIGGPGEFFGRTPASVGGDALVVGSGQILEGINISVSQP